MNDTNKTILYSVFIACFMLALCFWFHVTHLITDKNVITDKFTDCLQIAMSEARQSGKVIDIEKAKEVCLNIDNIKKNG